VLRDVGPRPGGKHRAKHRQWQMVGVGCTEVKALAHGLQKVLNALGKLTGNMAIIQPSQKPCTVILTGCCVRAKT
jgi:hypothetical protein